MHKVVMIAAAAVSLGVAASAIPTVAQAQYYGGYINQPRAYAPPAYAPPPVFAAPPVYRPRVTVTPDYRGNAYTDYRHFGDPSSRDALDTCAYC
jgi:hypothetical protein